MSKMNRKDGKERVTTDCVWIRSTGQRVKLGADDCVKKRRELFGVKDKSSSSGYITKDAAAAKAKGTLKSVPNRNRGESTTDYEKRVNKWRKG